MEERNYGIDFLRIFSMFMIVVLHVLGQGGILLNVKTCSAQYLVAWFLEIFSYCAVNCFALISGYVMCNSRIKIHKLLELWLQIVFYTLSITVIMFIAFPETRGIGNIINALFPISRGQYWYLSSYFAMYIFIPIMNVAINKLEKSTLRNILLAIFVTMSILPTLLRKDPYILSNGYSAAWLCILYLLGGYIRKYVIQQKIRKRTLMIAFFSAIVVTFLTKIIIQYCSQTIFNVNKSGNILISYVSPTIIIAGLSLFILCTKLKFKAFGRKIITFFSPAALGVYIIHVHPLVFNKIIYNFSIPLLNSNSFIMGLKVIVVAFLIWLVCSFIELFRIKLFKTIKVREVCCKIGDLLTEKLKF